MTQPGKAIAFLLFTLFAYPVTASDCEQFGNNHLMKWIDFDASCISRSDLIKKIESEGKWTLISENIDPTATLVYEHNFNSDETLTVDFLGFEHEGANILEVSGEIDCRTLLEDLPKLGFPKFPEIFYNLRKQGEYAIMHNIGEFDMLVFPLPKQGFCETYSIAMP